MSQGTPTDTLPSPAPTIEEKPLDIVERELPEIAIELLAMKASHKSTFEMSSEALHKTLDLVLEVLAHSKFLGRFKPADKAPPASP